MSYFDTLPIELLHVIASDSESAYRALLAYPRFARMITPGRRIDYMIHFGHDIRVEKHRIKWCRNGKKHRINGPAAIYNNQYILQQWCYDGARHRVGGPAVIYADGRQCWYRSGVVHRDDGPAVIHAAGEEWYKNGQHHRDDGPAVICITGFIFWIRYGQLHRDDGPALIFPSGDGQWFRNGNYIRETSKA